MTWKRKIKSEKLKSERLNYLRQQIDFLDQKIIHLIDQRMALAVQTSRAKKNIQDKKREKIILSRVKKICLPFLSENFTEKIIKTIMRESKQLQRNGLKLIGFQGERGAYGELAASIFNRHFKPVPCLDFIDVFRGVEYGWFDYGIVPVENSIEGQVSSVNDLFIESDLKIVGEVILPIHHCLLTLPGQSLSQISLVLSHPQALAQCKKFLKKHQLEPQPFYDTAGAARMISETRTPGLAAIAGKNCAQVYGLSILAENIEDFPFNQTRFLILARKIKTDGHKCSVVFSVRHRPGSLCQILSLFSQHDINLTRIESRPNKTRPGEYFFLIDFEASIRQSKIKKVLNQLEKQATFYRFLGCYKNFRPSTL